MYPVLLHCRRLVARTLPFQGGEAGSIPVDSTNFGDAATMVEWPRTVNPVLKKRNRFESYHLHQVSMIYSIWISNLYLLQSLLLINLI